MNPTRISELNKLISALNGTLKKLMTRKSNLEQDVSNAKNAQERIDYAVATAMNRVKALGSLGLRPDFLEKIIYPVQNKPDCSGVGSTVENEIFGIEEEIKQTNNSIWCADQEKKRLEAEDAV